MKLTKQEAIKLHREMWRRISELSDEEIEKMYLDDIKRKIIKDMGIEESISRSCFCCEYDNRSQCSNCPIDWGRVSFVSCVKLQSPYRKISRLNMTCEGAGRFDKFRNLAKQISELPERK